MRVPKHHNLLAAVVAALSIAPFFVSSLAAQVVVNPGPGDGGGFNCECEMVTWAGAVARSRKNCPNNTACTCRPVYDEQGRIIGVRAGCEFPQ